MVIINSISNQSCHLQKIKYGIIEALSDGHYQFTSRINFSSTRRWSLSFHFSPLSCRLCAVVGMHWRESNQRSGFGGPGGDQNDDLGDLLVMVVIIFKMVILVAMVIKMVMMLMLVDEPSHHNIGSRFLTRWWWWWFNEEYELWSSWWSFVKDYDDDHHHHHKEVDLLKIMTLIMWLTWLLVTGVTWCNTFNSERQIQFNSKFYYDFRNIFLVW